jgi:hypothetical protein
MKALVVVGTILGLLFTLSVTSRIVAQDFFNTSVTDSLSAHAGKDMLETARSRG